MTEREFLIQVLGHQQAIEFIETLGRISQGFDDLYDGDPLTKEQMMKVFWDALVTLPENPFYQQYFQRLQPLIAMACSDWQCANVLEHGSNQDKQVAFILRDSLTAIIVECARILHGEDVSRTVAIRRFVHDEKFSDYRRSVK